MGKRGVINPVYGMTDAAFFGKIRSSLRQQWKYSKPHKDAMRRAKVPYVGEGRRRVSVRCEKCHAEYAIGEKIVTGTTKTGKEKKVTAYAVHHPVEAGTLKCWDDISGFVERLFCPPEQLEVLCLSCHKEAHKKEDT